VTRRWLWRGVAVVAVGVLAASLLNGPIDLIVGTAAGSSGVDAPHPCPRGDTVPILDSPHVSQEKAASVRYNSDPATSGPHFSFSITPGIYADPVPPGLAVHALEHGHVAVLYARNTPDSSVRRLEAIARRYAAHVSWLRIPTSAPVSR
jgi:hypothetical protein